MFLRGVINAPVEFRYLKTIRFIIAAQCGSLKVQYYNDVILLRICADLLFRIFIVNRRWIINFFLPIVKKHIFM